ncbi:MAG TPA: amino acid permease [Candidatus Acidoferrales bacterium]|nr:amino acid permease [Candidatus Acidoferrales bacterium]
MTPRTQKITEVLLGPRLDPFSTQTRKHAALVAVLAWVGLGADALSSSCFGPEQAFLALGTHTHFGLYLAGATALTVFIIGVAYNQVIELFPSGGGGYKVATNLIGPYTGLVSGAALIVDYMLTIATSMASGVDAMFSLLPLGAQPFKLATDVGLVLLLMVLNLRGMKESIQVLLPIFLGFFVIHALLIAYGVAFHAEALPDLIPDTLKETRGLSREMGWVFALSLFLRAYSLGGGTYTGIEAVSNNVQSLAEPRVKTGKWTMFYMAVSLSLTAGGFILLYLLWNVKPEEGQTLNAVTFRDIIHSWGLASPIVESGALLLVLALEGALLFVGANTGFLGGPAVLANMAADSWVPHQYRYLSTRLVTQNGILLMGLASVAILLISGGQVSMLVVLYSINVFLTFSLSLAGLCIYWWQARRQDKRWSHRIVLSLCGLTVTFSILVITLVEKFAEGAWLTALITGLVIAACLVNHRHYLKIKRKIHAADQALSWLEYPDVDNPPLLDPAGHTAVLVVGSSRSGGVHALQWVRREFPGSFKNFIFMNVRTVDSQCYSGDQELEKQRELANTALTYFVNFCHHEGLASKSYLAFGTDPIAELIRLAEKVKQDFPNSVFFTSKLIFERDNWYIRQLHSEAALQMLRQLHLRNMPMVILPMRL